jgi:hypothetical protein
VHHEQIRHNARSSRILRACSAQARIASQVHVLAGVSGPELETKRCCGTCGYDGGRYEPAIGQCTSPSGRSAAAIVMHCLETHPRCMCYKFSILHLTFFVFFVSFAVDRLRILARYRRSYLNPFDAIHRQNQRLSTGSVVTIKEKNAWLITLAREWLPDPAHFKFCTPVLH